MAYVNMTVDGQTRRTDRINGKDVNGNTKTMTFEAVLEASDTQGGGITPSGKKTITNTQEQDVTNYATAQVVDSNLVAGNIKAGVSILGIAGNYQAEGGESGGASPNVVATGLANRNGNKLTVPVGSSDCDAIIIFEVGTTANDEGSNGLVCGFFMAKRETAVAYDYWWMRRYSNSLRATQGLTTSGAGNGFGEHSLVIDSSYGFNTDVMYIAIKF